MEFGEWLRSQRQFKGLDVRDLAGRSHVDPSTISRIENQHTQSTLFTAYRLCEGLNTALPDLYHGLTDAAIVARENNDLENSNTINKNDISLLLADYASNKTEVYEYFACSVNEIFAFLKGRYDLEFRYSGVSPQFTSTNMEALLSRTDHQVLQFGLEYPRNISSEDILYNYEHRGLLLLDDVGVYARKVRQSKRETLRSVESLTAISTSVISRLEDGILERLKLSDILTLDSSLDQSGKLIDMCWDICAFDEWRNANMYSRVNLAGSALLREVGTRLTEPQIIQKEKKLITLYIRTCRWFQYLEGVDFKWHKYSLF